MTTRAVIARTRGQQHGFIRRMVSPGDLGELIKPFVFLDHVEGAVRPGTGFGWHPHSGIATLTYSLNSDAAYEDTAGQTGIVAATGLEWMRAGSGTWHQGFIHPREASVTAFQLWVALPPGVEDGPPEGVYLAPNDVPQIDNVRVLLGEYGGRANPIASPSAMTYLDVVLARRESWTFAPPTGQSVAWAFVYRGRASVGGVSVSDELAVLDESEAPVTIEASSDARILFGSARKHDHPLVLGSHSVHTSHEALARGEARRRSARSARRSDAPVAREGHRVRHCCVSRFVTARRGAARESEARADRSASRGTDVIPERRIAVRSGLCYVPRDAKRRL